MEEREKQAVDIKYLIMVQIFRDILIDAGLTSHQDLKERLNHKLNIMSLDEETKNDVRKLI